MLSSLQIAQYYRRLNQQSIEDNIQKAKEDATEAKVKLTIPSSLDPAKSKPAEVEVQPLMAGADTRWSNRQNAHNATATMMEFSNSMVIGQETNQNTCSKCTRTWSKALQKHHDAAMASLSRSSNYSATITMRQRAQGLAGTLLAGVRWSHNGVLVCMPQMEHRSATLSLMYTAALNVYQR